jgi:hypothetical protein
MVQRDEKEEVLVSVIKDYFFATASFQTTTTTEHSLHQHKFTSADPKCFFDTPESLMNLQHISRVYNNTPVLARLHYQYFTVISPPPEA